jgi:hypothetical protein
MSSDEDWQRLADAELTHDIVVARIEVRYLAKRAGLADVPSGTGRSASSSGGRSDSTRDRVPAG